MAQILSFNSRLTYGHVGGEGAGFALRRLGHEVWQIPTVLYSNHPAHGGHSGQIVAAEEMQELLKGANQQNLLNNITALSSGYLGDAAQAQIILKQLRRSAGLLYLCDPAIGDNGALYVPEAVATAIRDLLVPQADIVTPNRFELGFLTRRDVADMDDVMDAARALIKKGPSLVICTSAQIIDGEVTTLAVTEDAVFRIKSPELADVPHGTGDVFAAIFLARYLEMSDIAAALSATTASLHGIIETDNAETPGELAIVKAQKEIVEPSQQFDVQQIE